MTSERADRVPPTAARSSSAPTPAAAPTASWLVARPRLHYSVDMTITEEMQADVLKVPSAPWAPAYGGNGQVGTSPACRTFSTSNQTRPA